MNWTHTHRAVRLDWLLSYLPCMLNAVYTCIQVDSLVFWDERWDEVYFNMTVYLLQYQALQVIPGCQPHRFLPVITQWKCGLMRVNVDYHTPDRAIARLTCVLAANSVLLLCDFDMKHAKLFTHYMVVKMTAPPLRRIHLFWGTWRHMFVLTFSPTPPIEPMLPGGPCAPCDESEWGENQRSENHKREMCV